MAATEDVSAPRHDEAAADDAPAPRHDEAADVEVRGQATGLDRSPLERVVRQVLLIQDASPRAIMDLRGSLVLSAIRCVITYALVPLLVPVIGWLGVLAAPLSLALASLAIVLAVNSLRRVWLADYRHRWAYTGFIVVAVTLLVVVIVGDLRTLLG